MHTIRIDFNVKFKYMYSCTLLKKTFTCLTKFSRGNFHPIIESKADKINKYLKLCQSLSILSLTRHEQEFPFPTYSRYCLVNSSKLGLEKVFFISIPNPIILKNCFFIRIPNQKIRDHCLLFAFRIPTKKRIYIRNFKPFFRYFGSNLPWNRRNFFKFNAKH